MTVTFNVDALKPTLKGPNTEALFAAVSAGYEPVADALTLHSRLDTRPARWIAGERDPLDLSLMAQQRHATLQAGATLSRQYRSLRLIDVGQWTHGTWADIVRLAQTWCQSETPDSSLFRVYTWPLSVAVLFAANVAPTAVDLPDLQEALLATISDVASYAILVGAPGLPLADLLILDIGPGLDVGVLADVIGP